MQKKYLIYLNKIIIKLENKNKLINVMGIGDWGLGIGDWEIGRASCRERV